MKKIIVFFMAIVICCCFLGCEDNSENVKKTNTNEMLTKVLNFEKSFTVYNKYIEKTTEQTLDDFKYPTYSNALNVFKPYRYTFADFDSDGNDELLIIDAYLSDFLFLKCNGKKVYGYVHKKISIPDIKTDGTFKTFEYDGYEAISTISFKGQDYEITNIAYKDETSGIYKLNGKTASKEKVLKYFEDWDKNTVKVELIKFE